MDDAALVRVRERHRHVAENVGAIGDRDLRPGLEQLAQRSAFDERHREERHTVRFAGGDDGNDVRILQLGDELDLAMKAVEADAARQVGREELDDDLSIEASLGREEDVTHPAATELALDVVLGAERGLEAVAKLGHGWDESSGISKNDRDVRGVRLATM